MTTSPGNSVPVTDHPLREGLFPRVQPAASFQFLASYHCHQIGDSNTVHCGSCIPQWDLWQPSPAWTCQMTSASLYKSCSWDPSQSWLPSFRNSLTAQCLSYIMAPKAALSTWGEAAPTQSRGEKHNALPHQAGSAIPGAVPNAVTLCTWRFFLPQDEEHQFWPCPHSRGVPTVW